MPSTRWDPGQYARFSDHRSRWFYELVARVACETPHAAGAVFGFARTFAVAHKP